MRNKRKQWFIPVQILSCDRTTLELRYRSHSFQTKGNMSVEKLVQSNLSSSVTHFQLNTVLIQNFWMLSIVYCFTHESMNLIKIIYRRDSYFWYPILTYLKSYRSKQKSKCEYVSLRKNMFRTWISKWESFYNNNTSIHWEINKQSWSFSVILIKEWLHMVFIHDHWNSNVKFDQTKFIVGYWIISSIVSFL